MKMGASLQILKLFKRLDKHIQFYASKIDKIYEMDSFLVSCNLLKQVREEIESLNSPISIQEIEPVI